MSLKKRNIDTFVKSKMAPTLKKGKKVPKMPVEEQQDDIDDTEFSSQSDITGSDIGEDSDGESDGMEPLEQESESSHNKRRLEVGDDEETNGLLTSKRKKRKSQGDPNKPLTAQEVTRLRETENLFHSSLFRLQIEEMLSELRIKKKREDQLSSWVSSLKRSIMSMNVKKEHHLMKQKWLGKLGISIPILQQLPVDGTFQFMPPVSVHVTGSYAIGCSLGPHPNIDIAIEMPKEFFKDQDIVNERYHRKRALYLCCIIAQLISSNIISVKMEHIPKFTLPCANNPSIPVAKVVPSGPLEGRAFVSLYLTSSEDSFKLTRLGPSKNCVRKAWFFNDSSFQDAPKGPPTPMYNSSIVMDLVAKQNEAVKVEVLKDSQPLRDAVVLLKVWLKQRELDQGFSTFGNYLMTMLVVYLARSRRLSAHMSSYQIIRTVWNFLKDQNWTTANGGITLCEDPRPGAPTLAEFHDHHEVLFIDCSGYCNLAAHVDTATFLRVKNESARALEFLDKASFNSFQALFMTPVPFLRYFDHILCFSNTEELIEMVSRLASKEQLIDGNQNPIRLAVKLLLSVLQRGLRQRVAEWGVKIPNNASWNITDPPVPFQGPLLFGLNLNAEHAFSILDKGPPANDPKAEEFRDFWGNKSELRRFQDGSISEAVVWLPEKDVTFADRRLVCRSIIKYLLEHKLSLSVDRMFYIADQVESLLHCPHVKPASFSYGTGEEATLAVLSSLNKLSSTLRGLSDLPLDITSIQGVSPVCRYTDVTPPLSTTHRPRNRHVEIKEACMAFNLDTKLTRLPPFISPVEVVLQLSQSGKWPNDAGAVKRIRASFNISIAKSLLSCGLTSQAFPSHVDVLVDGFIFRLRVAYGRESSLLRHRTLSNGMLISVESKEAQLLEKETVLIPRITGYLHGLHMQFPAFGPTACLVKRWISAHMFRFSHFPEEVLELLVAYLFVKPEPYLPPVQPQTAFLRFLYMLSSTNWHAEPIIVNFNNELSKDELSKIERRFTADRSQLPPLFIATPSDHERSSMTREAPTLTILVRMALLASESLKILQNLCLHPDGLELNAWKKIFRPSLDSFNLLIHIDPFMNTKRVWRIDSDVKNKKPPQLKPYVKTKDEKLPITGFDPVECYIKELEGSYGDLALFFHDTFGGSIIGVVWKPSALEPKDFKISHVNGRKISSSSKEGAVKLILNKDAIIEDFYILGEGLVKSIDVLDQDL